MKETRKIYLSSVLVVIGLLTSTSAIARKGGIDGDTEAEVTLALVGGHLIDGSGRFPVEDAVVLISGTRIQQVGRRDRLAVPTSATVVDVKGKTVLPGFIDAHNHLEGLGTGEDDAALEDSPEKLQQAILSNAQLDLQSGVTTIRELGSSDAVLRLREQIEAVGPRLYLAGQQLVKRDSSASMHPSYLDYAGAAEARRRVRELVAKGSNLIKVRITRQRTLPTVEELRAIVDETHRAGLKVAAHTDVPDEDAVRLAVQVGVDTIEHLAPFRANNDLLLRDIARRNVILVPSLLQMMAEQVDPIDRTDEELIESPLQERLSPELLQGMRKRAAIWRKTLEDWRTTRNYDSRKRMAQALRSVSRAKSFEVKMAVGPDTGSDLVPHGRIYRELALFAAAGVPVPDIIQMYAKNGAEAVGKEKELGTVEPGKFADLVVLDGDPVLDPLVFRNVVMVIKNGRIVEPPPKNTN